jgi:hypothetical protein
LNAKMAELADIKVVLQNPDGKYLAGSAINWWFTEDRFGAIVFDFWGQQVKEQLTLLAELVGIPLNPVVVPPQDVYETCDSCQCLFTARQVFFDGRRFLCAECQTVSKGNGAAQMAA